MDDAPRDLRARRRLDTYEEIHQATLELFEKQGVHATTVQHIADRAGVSARTFFRYFSSKEQAALPGQRRLLEAIDAIEVSNADPAPTILRKVEAAAEAAISLEIDPGLDEHRRVARLLRQEAELQALAAAQERVLTTHLRRHLEAQLPGAEPTALLLVAEVAVSTWRASWLRWGERVLDGEAVDPLTVYRECCAELRRAVG